MLFRLNFSFSTKFTMILSVTFLESIEKQTVQYQVYSLDDFIKWFGIFASVSVLNRYETSDQMTKLSNEVLHKVIQK